MSIRLLIEQGVAESTAIKVAKSVPTIEIQNQIKWLSHRNIQQSRAGYLVSACLGKYPDPERAKGTQHPNSNSAFIENAEQRAEQLKRFRQRTEALCEVWLQQTDNDRNRWRQVAIDRASDRRVRISIQMCSPTSDTPHKRVLDEMALELGLEPVSEHALRPQASATTEQLKEKNRHHRGDPSLVLRLCPWRITDRINSRINLKLNLRGLAKPNGRLW